MLGFLSIIGSGGGGGGTVSPPEPLVYTGNTSAAIITADNAPILVNNIIGTSNITGSIEEPSAVTLAPTESTILANLVFSLKEWLNKGLERRTVPQQSNSPVAVLQINETEPCIDGGSIHYSGTLNDDGTGLLKMDYDNCQENSETVDGLINAQIDAFNLPYLVATDVTMTFPRLTFKGPAYSYTASGSIRLELQSASNTEQMTINMVSKDNATNLMMKHEGYVLVTIYDNFISPTYYSMTQSGRVYDSVYGYVDVTTPQVLFYSNILNEYPDPGGRLLLSGAANSKAMMIPASALKVRIEIDSEGNDNFDEYRVYYWTAIGGELAPNEPPDVSSIVIQPDNAYTTDSLTVDTSLVSDPDADPLDFSYVWYKNGMAILGQTFSTLPAEQHIKGDLIGVEVTVSDGSTTASKSDSTTILNSPPVVNAGTDMTVVFGNEQNLSGSVSDADNDSMNYTWSVVSQPFDGNATLSDINVLDPVFSYSGQDQYTFQLSVSDGESISTDTINITVEPMPLFSPYTTIDIPSRTEAAAIGDLNSDGRNDIVVTTSYDFDTDNDSSVFVLLQDEFGNLSAPVRYTADLQPTQYQIVSVDVADLNNDGRDDIAISYENAIGVMLQNSQGTLDPITVYATTSASSYKVVASDFNDDGLKDIASIDWGTQSEDVDVFLQNISGTLNSPVRYTAPHGGYDDLASGDVNNDGLNDIVVMSGQSYAVDNLSILLQQVDNTFGAAVPYDLGTDVNSNAVGVGDINGDDRDDVILAYGGNRPSSEVAIFYQNASGTLDAPESHLSYDSPSAVEIADVNGDGRKDIIIGHSGWLAVGVYLQNSDGTLMGEQRYPFVYSANNPQRMAVGDINGDGQNDIVDASGTGITILYHR
jgi:hypothetical protein